MRRMVLHWWWVALAVASCGEQPTELATGGGDGGQHSCAMGVVCGAECVDLQSDPYNCGSCGRTCVVANGEAECHQGECAMGSCDEGWGDCDGNTATGCEAEIDCVEGASCNSSCDSSGTLDCSDACAPVCQLPSETCNLVDDNCDGTCDEGAIAGCRVGIHRSYGPLGHFYTADKAEAEGLGQSIEALNYFYLYATQQGDSRPFFRCKKPNNKRWLTTSTDCESTAAPELTAGYIAFEQECGAVPLYRLKNVAADAHFYTTSAPERDKAVNMLGFVDEGVAGYVWKAP